VETKSLARSIIPGAKRAPRQTRRAFCSLSSNRTGIPVFFWRTVARTVNTNPMWCDGLDLEADNVAAPEFAVDGKIEHGQISASAFDLQFGSD
jgi:hypothetical protein